MPKPTLKDSIKLICSTLDDYYYYQDKGGIQEEHVSKWLSQFDSNSLDQFASSFAYTLTKTYINREKMAISACSLVDQFDEEYDNFPQNFVFLNIQQDGQSQKRFLEDFIHPYMTSSGKQINNENIKTHYIYFDDVLYSGGRSSSDLKNWIELENVDNITLTCAFIYTHSYGIFNLNRWAKHYFSEKGKTIEFKIIKQSSLLNNKYFKNVITEVLHPKRVYEFSEDFF